MANKQIEIQDIFPAGVLNNGNVNTICRELEQIDKVDGLIHVENPYYSRIALSCRQY